MREHRLELDIPTTNLRMDDTTDVAQEETIEHCSTSTAALRMPLGEEQHDGNAVMSSVRVIAGTTRTRNQRPTWRRPGVLTVRFWVHRFRRRIIQRTRAEF
mmetsp:Transcript_12135/g.23293  ORF Transcript_12135/g.23293 Transcript_12135/m.23293 type:complete len:101 (+) Transcript_12135:48-350(+)